jgi:hypothetical protein
MEIQTLNLSQVATMRIDDNTLQIRRPNRQSLNEILRIVQYFPSMPPYLLSMATGK